MAITLSRGSPEGIDRDEYVVRFGRRVREAREALGWTQQDLASATGIDRVSLSLIEAGSREVGVSRVYLLAAALRVSPGYLFE